MTLTSIRNQIITILLKNEMFIMDQDSKNIKVAKNLIPIKTNLIEEALKTLESNGFLCKIKSPDNNNCYWILTADPNTREQALNITPYTAEAIANIINQYREAMSIKSGECDKTNILEEDIQSLIIICGTLLNNVEKKDGDDDLDKEDNDESDRNFNN